MDDNWNEKGCEKCRQGWLSENPPPIIAESIKGWTTLHKCQYCNAYWENQLRLAKVVDVETIKKYYPDAYEQDFKTKDN